ncbi:MAG TPA: hypothetical protein VMX55_13965 [candidate division Zixibacteria bacterium]|nr:hypothetical protein [candidate division Zixibacteria bacterium]
MKEAENTEFTFGENFVDLLTRIEKIPLEKIVEVSSELNCKEEFAGVIYLLSTDLNIEPNLILEDINFELERLKKVNQEIPEVETYLHKFAITEGKWIGYIRGAFPNKLLEEGKKIQPQFAKLGKVKDSDLITLATQIMMERQFIAANVIIPVIEKWQEEHVGSSYFDAAVRILAGFKKESLSEKIVKIMVSSQKKLAEQIQLLGNILSNAEQSNWIIRSLIEAEILFEDFSEGLEEITYKGAADIILWNASEYFEKKIGDFTAQQDISKLIMKFQLESSLGLSTATPMAKLEYNLLSLTYKDNLAKTKLAEEMILNAWKEARLGNDPIDIGREILALLIDYTNVSLEFLGKVPQHFDFIVENFKNDKMRLARALERIKIKGKEPTDKEKQEAIVLDYLIQFTVNYIVGKMTADVKDMIVPERSPELDMLSEEKDIVDMIDAALRRGIRTQNKSDALKILDSQILSFYQRLLDIVRDEVKVGECIIYGIFNSHGIELSRERARELVEEHFRRMMVSTGSSGKKRIDSAVRKAISIEIEEKIINRDIK